MEWLVDMGALVSLLSSREWEKICGMKELWKADMPEAVVVSGWCYAIEDQVLPGMSERTLVVAKEAEVSRLREGAMELCGEGEDLREDHPATGLDSSIGTRGHADCPLAQKASPSTRI